MTSNQKYKVGDMVRIEEIPPGIEKTPEILVDFKNAVGKIFNVKEIDSHGNIVIHVTDTGPLLSIEPEYVSLASSDN